MTSLTMCLAILLAMSSGCTRNSYRPGRMPSELLAPPVENTQTVDLSRLSSHAVSSEMIEPGDVVEVTIVAGFSERNPTRIPVRIGEDGNATIPLVGMVALGGLELDAAGHAISSAAIERNIYRNPHVTVVMEKKRVNRITVVGAVPKPGVYELPRGSSDLLAAIVAAGGLAEDAGIDVDVRSPARRSSPGHRPSTSVDRTANAAGIHPAGFHAPTPDQPSRSVRINLVTATLSGGEDLRLRDGDVVSVAKRDPKPLQVLGLVRKPGRYEMPPNQELRVLDAIALAGGISSSVADEIIVIRRTPDHPDAAVIKVSLSHAKADGAENIVLASGDVISVEQTVATVAMDAIKNFVRIGLSSRIPVF